MVDTNNPTDDLKQRASETAGAARAEAEKRAEGAKSSIADEIAGIASALTTASHEFDEDSLQARTFRQMADGLSGTSRSLRGKSLGEMLDELNGFARNNPTAFLGGAAALGFAASRFAVASRQPQQSDRPASDAPARTPSAPATPVAAKAPAAPAARPASSPTTTTTRGVKP